MGLGNGGRSEAGAGRTGPPRGAQTLSHPGPSRARLCHSEALLPTSCFYGGFWSPSLRVPIPSRRRDEKEEACRACQPCQYLQSVFQDWHSTVPLHVTDLPRRRGNLGVGGAERRKQPGASAAGQPCLFSLFNRGNTIYFWFLASGLAPVL